MGKSAPTPPPAPDYTGAAIAQGQANIDAANAGASLSNPNIISPYGNQNVTYDATGPNGSYQPTVTQTLTPAAQATLDSQQQVQQALGGLAQQGIGTAQDVLGNPFQYQGPDIQTSLSGTGQTQGNLDLSQVAKAPVNAGTTAQNAIMSRLQPQIQQSNDALTQQLANQGITPGSEAYNRAMTQQQQGSNDLLTQAALQGINVDMAANQQGYNQALGSAGLYNTAQNQQFNQGLQGSQFGNQAAQQSLAQQLQLYNQPLNQISALMSGSQIQTPQFQGYTGQNVQAAPVANATAQQGQWDQNNYNNQMSAYNSGMQGIGGLFQSALGAAPALLAMSDARLKSDIVRVGIHPLGIGIYEYDIFGKRERGVMAQELETILPSAVITLPSGYKAVNYGALNG